MQVFKLKEKESGRVISTSRSREALEAQLAQYKTIAPDVEYEIEEANIKISS